MIRIRFVFPIAAIVLTGIHSYAAMSNTFGEQDYQIFRNLTGRISVVSRDILESQRALIYQPTTASYECLTNISTALESVSANLSELTTLIGISSRMINSVDERFVNQFIGEDISLGLRLVGISRQGINLAAGHCASSAIVTTKAQSILYLFTEIENALRLISRRV